jgi:phenylalanyl-tRNA synthetase beta chain
LRPQRTRDLLGVDIPDDEQVRHLESIELAVYERTPEIQTRIPTFRPDVTREVDLIEEIARLAGLHRLHSTVRTGVGGGLERDQELERVVKRALSGMGMQEVWTNSFSSPGELDRLGLASDDPVRNMVTIANPSSEYDTSLRTTLLPALLEMASRNAAHRAPGVAAYEVARVYQPRRDVLPVEEQRVGLIFSGRATPAWWGGDEQRWDLFSAKGIIEALARSLGLGMPAFEELRAMPFHPTRAARLTLSGRRIGSLGEIHPEVCDRFEVPEGTVAGEVAMQPLIANVPDAVTPMSVDRFPPVYLDVAFIVDDSVPASLVTELIAEAGAPEVSSVRLFDLYTGEQVEPGSRSLAFALELRTPEGTMTDEEALAVRDRIVETLRDRTGATLRG